MALVTSTHPHPKPERPGRRIPRLSKKNKKGSHLRESWVFSLMINSWDSEFWWRNKAEDGGLTAGSGLNENTAHRLRDLYTWSLAGAAVWGG